MENKQEAKKRIKRLKELINHYRYLYHVKDKEEISADALDSLKKELYDLEKQFPYLVTPDSPTQRVEGSPLKEFQKVRHYGKMLSFQDAFTEEDMRDFEKRIKRLVPENEINYFCELKVDGLAVELVYKEGVLEVGSTRGDGVVGEDVTQNLKTIDSIPLALRSPENFSKTERAIAKHPGWEDRSKSIVVRGEVFLSKEEFFKLNKEQEKKGLPPYANPRNIAAGSIRQLDPKIPAKRSLGFLAYDLAADLKEKEMVTPFGVNTHQEKHKVLRSLGFKTVDKERYCQNLQEVFSFYKEVEEERESYSYQIDGIAVFVNSNRLFNNLGVAGKAPRGGIAYKFPLEQSTTIVKDVVFQIGRTGAVTPVAILEPVLLGGVTVSRATLHNEDEIKKLGVKIEDTVVVGRAGDVIPKVIKTLKELRSGKEKSIVFPQKCPFCQSTLIRPKGEARWYCKSDDCVRKEKEKLAHFVSKKGFDIEGLGEKMADKLIEEGLVSSVADIFHLKKGDLLPLERFAEKSTDNLLKEIEKSKKISFSKFLQALSIPYVGEGAARALSYHFLNLYNLEKASIDEILNIPDIGPITAKNVYEFFQKEKNRKLIERLREAGVVLQEERKKEKLQGKTFVITGTLENLKREEAEERVSVLGGKVSSSISSNTDYLVAGANPGSKLQKAKEAGVRILTEKDFLKLIESDF